MNKQVSFKQVFGVFTQGLGAMLAFLVSLVLANMLSPLSPEIMAAGATSSGFFSAPLAFLFNAFVNALILVWAARRSSFKGLKLVGQLFVLSFGAQVFMTQIETGYFLSAFPLLQNNFELYNLILRGLITSAFFSLLVALLAGGFSHRPRPQTAFTASADTVLKHGAWLALAYLVLYMLFGYFVAWQTQELRLFYGGPAELNGFFEQWGSSLMQKPELPVFQYFRGFLWLACLAPLFQGFSGKRSELVILSTLALGLLPTAQLAFANPLMPAAVSLGHFWEVSISTGIFGAVCAWFVPQPVKTYPEQLAQV
jgi:hypothetical protein